MSTAKINSTLPTATQMQEFAKRFDRNEWSFLCSDPQFISLVQRNIKKAWIHAIRTLAQHYSIERNFETTIANLIATFRAAGMDERLILAHLQKATVPLIVEVMGNGPESDDDDLTDSIA